MRNDNTNRLLFSSLEDSVTADDVVSWLAAEEIAVLNVNLIARKPGTHHAFVTLVKPEDLDKAIARYDRAPQANGKLLSVMRPVDRSTVLAGKPQEVFCSCGNVISEDELRDLALSRGVELLLARSRPVRILRNPDGTSRGLAFISCRNKEAADDAIELLTGQIVPDDFRLRCEHCRPRPSAVSRQDIEASAVTTRSLVPESGFRESLAKAWKDVISE